MADYVYYRNLRRIEIFLISLILFVFHTAFSQEFNLSPGNKFILRTEAFSSDSDSLDKPLISSIIPLGAYLQPRPDLKIEVDGYCDSSGAPEHNQDLSFRRAKNVKEYLVKNYSIPAGNIVTKGLGSSNPIASNATPEGRAKNRRIEIKPISSLTARALTDDNNNATNEEGALTFFNGSVQTKAPWDIGFGDAFLKEPIYELHKINTKTESRAEVTFNDKSRLQVGENSLVIVYGLESKEPAIKEKGNIELVKGDLLARLEAIQHEQKYVIKTPSAQMEYNSIAKSKLAVDKSDRSTVSMFEGNSEVSAAGQSIQVPENFGTQIFRDKAPEPPRQLPDPPTIFTPDKGLLAWSKDGVTFTWKPNSYAARLEVSRDTSFNDLVWATTTRKTLSKADLTEGTYYWHMQGVDSVGLEGKPGDLQTLVVKKYDYDQAKLDLVTVESGINTVSDPDVELRGTVDPGTLVKVNGERMFIEHSGTFSMPLHLNQGDNTYIIEARDSAGFENSKTVIYRYVTSKPFGVTLGFSPVVAPNKYGTLKVGTDFTLKFPQLFGNDGNLGIALTAGEFLLSNPKGDTVQQNPQYVMRPYGLAELLLTIDGSHDANVVPYMEVSSGAFLWPVYHGSYYSTNGGAAYEAGLGIGLRTNGPTSGLGIQGVYRWITNDYLRFDPYASRGFHGLFDFEVAYFIY